MPVADLTRFHAALGPDPMAIAFAAQGPMRPKRSAHPVPEDAVDATWRDIIGQRGSGRPRIAYLHVPFCANHCLFCGFYRNAFRPEVGAAYTDRLVEEIARDGATAAIGSTPVEAVYFGGGTPSALSAKELARLITAVRTHLPLAPGCEITIEGRIIHFDPEKIDACLDAGCNRISIGVQSFDTDVRRRQGRRSSKEEAIAFLAAIRDRDRAALVIDLMFGLPGQTEAVWREDLRVATDLAPDGLDLYRLGIIPGTPLFQAVKAGKFPDRIGLAEQARMYQQGIDHLDRVGWAQIGNKHWARTPRERNIYNFRIKEGVDCLAFGSGAGGMLNRHHYGVDGTLDAYDAAIDAGRKPVVGLRVADDLQPGRDVVTAGLEVGRLDLSAVPVDHLDDLAATIAPLVDQWQEAGLLAWDGRIIDLSPAGRFWYANLITAIDTIIAETRPEAERRPVEVMSL